MSEFDELRQRMDQIRAKLTKIRELISKNLSKLRKIEAEIAYQKMSIEEKELLLEKSCDPFIELTQVEELILEKILNEQEINEEDL